MTKTAFINGKVYVEKGVYKEAVLQEDGIIKLVGTNDEIKAAMGDAEVIDCQGKTVIPGFNDSHMHMQYLGQSMLFPNLSKCKSAEECVDVCIKFRKENPDVKGIYCQSWNQDNFDEGKKRLPDRHDLDKIGTDIPIVLSRICGHSSAVNTLTLDLMGLNKENNKVAGGDVILEEDGMPNGYLCENAAFQARAVVPPISMEQHKKALLMAMDYAVAHGMTTTQSNDFTTIIPDPKEAYELLTSVYEDGSAPMRYTAQVGCPTMDMLKDYVEGPHFLESRFNDWYRMGPLKMFKDGSLGARTGMMRHEYYDDPGNYGVETTTDKDQQEMVDYATAHGLQVVTHVIGDDAIERTTKIYRKANGNDENKLRHSLIHCQITDKPLMEYIKATGTLIAYQPIFLQCDLHAVESRCGKEMSSTSYAMKTAFDLGIHASYGTDCPVEDCNPFPNIFCAVTRKDLNCKPEGGFYPQECVDVETAIDAYTAESAYHEFREDVKGRIKPGFYADMVVLDTDIFTVEHDKIKDILPVLTMCGGKIVFRK